MKEKEKEKCKALYREKMEELETTLGALQRECRELEIPVMIAFEGYGAAGKGVQIGKLIHALDPRGFEVHPVKNETTEEKMHPFLWRFWKKMPEKGRIAIYDSSWYHTILLDVFTKGAKKKSSAAFEAIRGFEHQLADDGTVLIKIFLTIDKKEQKKRFKKLLSSKETAWRVSKLDLKCNDKFEKYETINQEVINQTNTEYAPWNVVESLDRRATTIRIYEIVIQEIQRRITEISRGRNGENKGNNIIESEEETPVTSVAMLAQADLSLSLTKEEYTKQLKQLQDKIEKLHGELYRRRIPVVLGFEGWDAGGKGGAIKRLTEKMDPRGYVVHPTASPNDIERAHHYLWRFWTAMPKDGHVTIFDRTWYGRVMVERIEGFCKEAEWKRAYEEINNMEKTLTDSGAIVLKFWMQIDKDEQERRFKARQDNPQKQWKITDEDWRNREKWDQYEEAVNEMIMRTSTENAPWIVVEGNCKYYARIKVLQSVVDAIESRL